MMRIAWQAYQGRNWREAQNSFFDAVLSQPMVVDGWRGLLLSALRMRQFEFANIIVEMMYGLFTFSEKDQTRLEKIKAGLEQKLLGVKKEKALSSDEHILTQRLQVLLRQEKGVPALLIANGLCERFPHVPYYRILRAHALDIIGQLEDAMMSFDEALEQAARCVDGGALYAEVALQRLEFLADINQEQRLKNDLKVFDQQRHELSSEQVRRMSALGIGG